MWTALKTHFCCNHVTLLTLFLLLVFLTLSYTTRRRMILLTRAKLNNYFDQAALYCCSSQPHSLSAYNSSVINTDSVSICISIYGKVVLMDIFLWGFDPPPGFLCAKRLLCKIFHHVFPLIFHHRLVFLHGLLIQWNRVGFLFFKDPVIIPWTVTLQLSVITCRWRFVQRSGGLAANAN